MLKFLQGSKLLPSIASQVLKSNGSAVQSIHTVNSKEEQERTEKLKDKMSNFAREDIDHDVGESFYINPKFAKEVAERFGIKSDNDTPDTAIKAVSSEQVEKSKQNSQTK